MRYPWILFCFLLAFLPMSCGSPAPQQEKVPPRAEHSPEGHVARDFVSAHSGEKIENAAPGQILVKFKKGTEAQVIEQIQQKLGLETVRVVSRPSLYLMKTRNGVSVQEMVKRLQEFSVVEYAEPNYRRTIQ